MNYTIKKSKIVIATWIILGVIVALPAIGTADYGMLILTAIFFLMAFLAYAKRIELVGFDAKYSSLLSRKSIKQIEAIDVVGFGFLNKVKISGRGATIISLAFVADLDEVKRLAEKIDAKR